MGLRRNKKLKTWLAGSQPVRVAGSRPQGPVGQVSRGLGARAPRAWGPARQGPGPFPHKNHPTSQITIFSQTSCGEGVGVCFGGGDLEGNEAGIPPLPPPPTPPPRFGAVEEGFHPLRLRQPSNTPPKVGGYRDYIGIIFPYSLLTTINVEGAGFGTHGPMFNAFCFWFRAEGSV